MEYENDYYNEGGYYSEYDAQPFEPSQKIDDALLLENFDDECLDDVRSEYENAYHTGAMV